MKYKLEREIINYILDGLGVYSPSRKLSIFDKSFLLDKKINIEDEKPVSIYGCQADIEGSQMRIMLTDLLEHEDDYIEFYLIIKYANSPYYAFFLLNTESFTEEDSFALYSVDGKMFDKNSISMSASLLLGMEQLKDIPIQWKKMSSYDDMYSCLISSIDYANGMV